MMMIVMATLELPRYCFLAHAENYNSITGYTCHIVASFFYFLCLLVVAYLFAQILALGSKLAMLYSQRWLIIAIIIKGIIDLVTIVYCLLSQNLGSFFSSAAFKVYTIFDIFQNLLYSSILTFFGLRLIYRYISC